MSHSSIATNEPQEIAEWWAAHPYEGRKTVRYDAHVMAKELLRLRSLVSETAPPTAKGDRFYRQKEAPECADGCQYAKDVGMYPEHRCADQCRYAAGSPVPSAVAEPFKDTLDMMKGRTASAARATTASISPELRDVLREYDAIISKGNFDPDPEWDFVMRRADYRLMREALAKLPVEIVNPPKGWTP